MTKYTAPIVFMVFLSCFAGRASAAVDEYAKNIEIIDPSINYTQYKLPRLAYLCMELKNNGDKKIANVNFEISYYDKEGYPIKKVILKNRLTEALPSQEARKYKIKLNGDVFNFRNEEYPFSHGDDVGEFDLKILRVKFARK